MKRPGISEEELLEVAKKVVRVVKKHTTDDGTGIDVPRAAITVCGGGFPTESARREYQRVPVNGEPLSRQES